LAEASGKPTKFYLFANEFNRIKTYFNYLKGFILGAYMLTLDDIIANGDLVTNRYANFRTQNIEAGIDYTVSISGDGLSFYDNLTATGVVISAAAQTGNQGNVVVKDAGESTKFLAFTTDVDDAITQLINGAPSDANTLKELNDKILAINAIIGGSTADGDSIVNTVAELLHVFQTYPEGSDIATVLAGKIDSANIVNNLTQVVAGKVLDASQGKVLKDMIETLTANVNTALAGKVDKVTGKGLSTEDYTTTEKSKLAAITGTNTGDETGTTIKSKLGISTLSGSNTGDQDLSGLQTKSVQIKLASTYTLANQTALQKIFNTGGPNNDGSFNVISGVKYEFEISFSLSNMSGTSGNFQFGLLGTAGISALRYTAFATKNGLTGNSTPNINTFIVATASVICASTGFTVGHAYIKGSFTATSSGTVYLSTGLSIAAAAIIDSTSYATNTEK